MSWLRHIVAVIGACLALAGCSLAPPAGGAPTATPAAPTATPVSPSPTPPSVSPTVTPETPCAFSWAYQDAPGVPERAGQLLADAGITPAALSARVFGESCVDAQGQGGFLAMATTIEIELPAADLADDVALAATVAQVVGALADLEGTVEPQPELRLTFVAGDERRSALFRLAQGRAAIDRGLSGAALLEALRFRP